MPKCFLGYPCIWLNAWQVDKCKQVEIKVCIVTGSVLNQ